MKKQKRRIMVLTEGKLGVFSSKTGTSVIRYCTDEVVCVLDSKAARSGRPLESFIGIGHGIPLVASVKEGLAYKPTELLIGIAPVGGELPAPWRKIILQALAAKLDIVSGLHQALNEDAELVKAAKKSRARLFDVRIPPGDIGVAEDRLRALKQRRISVVGSDCSVGKMVTAIEVDKGLRARDWDSEFVATGQTGIMIAGSGIAVDHVLSDYVNGAAERLCWERRKREVLVIEGQGSVYHPAYSGVTVGLLHGAMPHVMLFTHATARTQISHYEQYKLPPLKQAIQLVEDLTRPLQFARVAAVALNTVGRTDEQASEDARRIEDETGLPAADPIRHGVQKLVDAVEPALTM
ncbi:MAG TPA: DUF1611 domain-containing protein [Planctomycetota bacterium]|nr:DUF1611 domain-containing protein [Planctomycetota bacterium]